MSEAEPVHVIVHCHGDDVAMAVMSGIAADAPLNCWTMDRDETVSFTVHEAIPLGHKVAVRAIRRGDTVTKYGSPIGIASRDIRAGEHVHIHNLRSTRW